MDRPAVTRLILCLVLFASVHAGLIQSANSQYAKRLVFVQGDEAPGAGGMTFLDTYGTYTLSNDGGLLFGARLQPEGSGHWIEREGILRVAYRANETLSLEGGEAQLGQTWNYRMDASGYAVLFADLTGPGVTAANQNAILVDSQGERSVLAREGGSAPGISGRTIGTLWVSNSSIDIPANGGRVAVAGSLVPEDNSFYNGVLWLLGPRPEDHVVVSRENESMPGVNAVYGSFSPKAVNPRGQLVYTANGITPPEVPLNVQVVYRFTPPGSYEAVLEAPATSVFEEVTINENGDVGLIHDGAIKVFAADGLARTVLSIGDEAPGADGATFDRLYLDPLGGFQSFRLGFVLRNDGTVAVLARLSDGRRGIWVEEDGALRKVVLEGEAAAGIGGGATFAVIPTMHANNRGEVAFAAGLTGFIDHGIWTGTPAELRLVAKPGDSIEVNGETEEIECISLPNSPFGCFADAFASGAAGTVASGHPTQFNDEGELLFHINFDEGVNALVVAGEPKADLRLTLKALGRPEVGAYFSIGYEVRNVGSKRASNVEMEVSTFFSEISFFSSLRCDLSAEVLTEKALCSLPDLEPGETTDVWIIAYGNSEGLVDLFAEVASVDASAFLDLELNVLTREAIFAAALARVGTSARKRAGDVDVYVEGVRIADDLTPGAATGYLPVTLRNAEARVDVTDAAAPDNSAPLATFTLGVGATPEDTLAFSERTFLLLAESAGGSFELIVKEDVLAEAADGGTVDLFFAHVVSDAPRLAVRIEGSPAAQASLEFGETSEYFSLEARDYFVLVTDESGGEVLRRIYLDLSAAVGQAAALVVSGSLSAGTLTIDAFDASGAAVPTPIEGPDPERPDRLVLEGNYPNPFNPSTTIRFDLPDRAAVRVDVFDMLGRRVLATPETSLEAGFGRTLTLDAARLPSGAYLYRVTASSGGTARAQTGKMIVLK